MIAITICATAKYTYAMHSQARRVAQNIAHAKLPSGVVILVGDGGLDPLIKYYSELLPAGWSVSAKQASYVDGMKNYKVGAQLVIAQMRTAAFAEAIRLNADFCWSLDSDVLPPHNALEMSLWALAMPGGYYRIAFCPYPSQGGGHFLGGFGTPQKQIADDFSIHEKAMPPRMRKLWEGRQKSLRAAQDAKDLKLIHKHLRTLHRIEVRAQSLPPSGNIWEMNAQFGWRRRGWMDQAYPGIGKGAIVPIDWCGFGCTLMTREALCAAEFAGYDGGGTEDLYIIWNRWFQHDMRIAQIAHCPCDHVIRNREKPGTYTHIQSFHESNEEYRGHLRQRSRAHYEMIASDTIPPDEEPKVVSYTPDWAVP